VTVPHKHAACAYADRALAPDTLAADIIMKPATTKLLIAARARGLPTHPGLPTLTEQIELHRRFFRVP
jgi:shikimate dehydrogenase